MIEKDIPEWRGNIKINRMGNNRVFPFLGIQGIKNKQENQEECMIPFHKTTYIRIIYIFWMYTKLIFITELRTFRGKCFIFEFTPKGGYCNKDVADFFQKYPG